MNKILILFLVSLLSCTIPPKKPDWARYQETTLKEFISYFAADTIITVHPILKLVVADAPFKTKVNFTGSIRPISEQKAMCIDDWMGTMKLPKKAKGFADQEILIEQDGIKLWLVIQNSIISDLQTGNYHNPIEIFFQYIGVVSEGKGAEWVLLINNWYG
jgi:hypothetical protein